MTISAMDASWFANANPLNNLNVIPNYLITNAQAQYAQQQQAANVAATQAQAQQAQQAAAHQQLVNQFAQQNPWALNPFPSIGAIQAINSGAIGNAPQTGNAGNGMGSPNVSFSLPAGNSAAPSVSNLGITGPGTNIGSPSEITNSSLPQLSPQQQARLGALTSSPPGYATSSYPNQQPYVPSAQEAAYNNALYQNPLNPAEQQHNAEMQTARQTEAVNNVNAYQDWSKQASTLGIAANNMIPYLGQFGSAYNAANLKGSTLGALPYEGWSGVATKAALTALGKTTNMSPEQEMRSAANNMATTLAGMAQQGHLTDYQLNNFMNLKESPIFDQQAQRDVAGLLGEKVQRINEMGQFGVQAQQLGVPAPVMQVLWNNYNNQRELYNFKTHQPNDFLQNSFGDYLTPQAIAAAKAGTPYVPLPQNITKSQFSNWYPTLSKGDRIVVRNELAAQNQGSQQ